MRGAAQDNAVAQGVGFTTAGRVSRAAKAEWEAGAGAAFY